MNGWRVVTEREGAGNPLAQTFAIGEPIEFELSPLDRERAAHARMQLRRQIAHRNNIDNAHALGVSLERLA